MSILHNLWHGKIIPQERTLGSNKDFERTRKQLQEEQALLANELSEDGKIHFENYECLSAEIHSICDEENFIAAFRLGAKMMMDILTEKE